MQRMSQYYKPKLLVVVWILSLDFFLFFFEKTWMDAAVKNICNIAMIAFSRSFFAFASRDKENNTEKEIKAWKKLAEETTLKELLKN